MTAAGALGWVWWLVVKVPCPEIEPERIASILGKESPVYYRDGQEKIGVLFEDIHRQYLTYEQLPKVFVNALVAAEDDQFFHHYGIDPPGIAKALLLNYQAGKIVRGGSTLTQQTAKNLFKRPERTYQAKLKEMLYALRLEHRYSKEKILEFYSNQFYVSGNGHGLGVAARYYFNKEPQELALVETAFIAGSVKRPNYYNPFIKKDKAAAVEARLHAEERVGYVLARMLKFNMISQAEHDAAKKAGLLFRRGRTSYDLTTVMDMVQEGLASKAMTEMLAQHGIDNIATSGAKIITTIDQRLQEETLYSLRRELSRLDVQLRGYGRDEVQLEYKDAEGDNSEDEDEIREKAFVFGTIKEINQTDPEQPTVAVSFGPKHPGGLIDRQGLDQLLTALTKHRRQQWAKPGKQDLSDLLARLKPGDKVYVSVREADIFDGLLALDLERYPKLQGAALVLQQGAVRALASGVENRFFNRAADAKRLLGSTMKPFLYAAALQLGWSPLDRLDNRRRAFIFLDQAYFPRPDHKSPFAQVSMSWAGVKSENVASVWLLYHLTDKLTPAGLLETAASVDMTPRPGESDRQFSARMQSSFGLHVSNADLECAAFARAVRKAEADFQFEGRLDEHHRWREIGCGQNLEKFRAQVRANLSKPNLTPEQRKEYNQQLSLLGGGLRWPDLRRRRQTLDQYREHLNQLPMPAVQVPSFFPNAQNAPLVAVDDADEPRPFGRLAENAQGRLVFTLRAELPESWKPVDEFELRRRVLAMHPEERNHLWSNVLLEGSFSAGAVDIIERLTAAEKAALGQSPPRALETLLNMQDYRTMLGLQYLLRLAREAGIKSKMEPVLSFPLGSNVISLLDSVRMYETLVTGNRHEAEILEHFAQAGAVSDEDQDGLDGLALIERIEVPGGKVIYTRKTAIKPVLDAKTSSEVSSILQNVVRYGTGHAAWETVRLPGTGEEKDGKPQGPALPLMGKTGTANDYRNVAFLGFVPTGVDMDGTALLSSTGYTVGAYVGFDTNEPMKNGSFRVSGAVGALPVWNRIAETLYKEEGVADRLTPEALAGSSIGLRYPETGQLFMPVDDKGGGLMRRGKDGIQTDLALEEPAILSHGVPGQYGGFEPERRFMPFWLLRRQQPLPQPAFPAQP
ncbi:transglycosylase domain-containing protein [Candidatus Electronema sp. PJ]|uniref:transglycosylase domain-containing protein n=1 Tax=Candidatus Electronema sp. PJ TaxID=3401572 RepID=UPI003AA7C5FE